MILPPGWFHVRSIPPAFPMPAGTRYVERSRDPHTLVDTLTFRDRRLERIGTARITAEVLEAWREHYRRSDVT